MKHQILILGFLTLLFNHGFSQNNKVSLDQTYTSWLDSKFVNDKYLIECYIPENISAPIDSLPIIFVLDADMSFGLTYDIVRWLRLGREIPDVAIIGIAYGTTQSDWLQKRSRDYSMSQDETELWGKWPLAGGGENFMDFIEKELFPFIAAEYNLISSNKTLVGLSFGGLISMEILFSKPYLFNGYIVAGPALQWNNREIFYKEEEYAEKNKILDAIVFMSVGSLDDRATSIEPWNDFNNQVLSRGYRDLIYEINIIENETHFSMFPSALTKGLKFVLNQ